MTPLFRDFKNIQISTFIVLNAHNSVWSSNSDGYIILLNLDQYFQ